MATALEQVREALNNVQPGDVSEVHITELPDGSMRIEVLLHKAAIGKTGNTSQWAQFAEAMHRNSPLHGLSETLCQHSREFRDNWVADE